MFLKIFPEALEEEILITSSVKCIVVSRVFELFRSLENCDFLLLSESFSFFEANSIRSVAKYTESSIVTCEINSILCLFYYV